MTIPDWWEFALLGLATFRIWRILAVDYVTQPIRDWATRVEEYHQGRPQNYRQKLDEFITCPWCFGWWIVVAWWLLFQVWEFGVLVVSVPFALSAVTGYLAKWDS